jgi:predicted ATPase
MIEQIIIENYKSIHLAKVPMKNLNVLIGSNGVGKSNFISFLELIQKMFDQQLGSFILGQGGIERFLYQGSKHSDFMRGLIDFNNKNAFFFMLKSTIDNKAFIEYSGDYFNINKDSEKKYTDNSKWNKTFWDKAVEESGIKNSKKWRAGYLQEFIKGLTVYHFHDSSKNSPMRRGCPIDDNTSLRHDGSNLAAFLYRLQEQEPKSLKLIEGVVRSIAPYFKGFKLQPSRITPDTIKLEWEEIESDMYLDAQSFSDGTIRFIALATVLLQPKLPDTIIIDEPELGLHPSAINKLAALMKKASKKTQLIVATQSVNLVDCFEAEDIIVVDRKDNQTVFSRLSSDDLSAWIDDYSMGEIWEKNVIGGQP